MQDKCKIHFRVSTFLSLLFKKLNIKCQILLERAAESYTKRRIYSSWILRSNAQNTSFENLQFLYIVYHYCQPVTLSLFYKANYRLIQTNCILCTVKNQKQKRHTYFLIYETII